MSEERGLKHDLAQALVDAPGHLVRYVGGLIVALLGDYSLITLLIFVVLLGVATGSVLIAVTTFFGAYFVLRLVGNVADVIGYHAERTGSSIMQVAGATAQLGMAVERLNPPLVSEAVEANSSF